MENDRLRLCDALTLLVTEKDIVQLPENETVSDVEAELETLLLNDRVHVIDHERLFVHDIDREKLSVNDIVPEKLFEWLRLMLRLRLHETVPVLVCVVLVECVAVAEIECDIECVQEPLGETERDTLDEIV